jgi:hypothetical protein
MKTKKLMIAGAALAGALITPQPAMAAQGTYDVYALSPYSSRLLLDDASAKEAVDFISAPEYCGTWFASAGVTEKYVLKFLKDSQPGDDPYGCPTTDAIFQDVQVVTNP